LFPWIYSQIIKLPLRAARYRIDLPGVAASAGTQPQFQLPITLPYAENPKIRMMHYRLPESVVGRLTSPRCHFPMPAV
jgi:hypothetical protein